MTGTIRSAWKIIIAAVLGVLLLFSAGFGNGYARADEAAAYDNTDVLDDLEGAIIEGKPFNLSDYDFDDSKNLTVISFAEYCYSYDPDNLNDYALYIYVYNPQGLDITDNTTFNYIQMSCTGTNYTKYPLQLLSRSTRAGYGSMFYKFKILLTDTQRANVLQSLNRSARVYSVSGIELLINGDFNATEFEVANTYTYTGYSLGYGPSAESESTLSCVSTGLTTLTLNVHGAAYTPEGTSGSNAYTKDMLHSVYFSVPEKTVNEYGDISKIFAQWLNARTTPILITDNSELYNAISPDIGREIPDHLSYRETQPYGFASDIAIYNSDSGYEGWEGQYNGEFINPLYYIFLADDENSFINNYGQYVLSGDVVLDYIRNYSSEHSETATVGGKYSTELFESHDPEYTNAEIAAGDEFTLTNQKLTYEWWEQWLMLDPSKVVSTEFENINAIYRVKSGDVSTDISKTCSNLYINESYYQEFKSFYDTAIANNEVVYLFRYYQSQYLCDNAAAEQWVGTNLQPNLYRIVSGQHYVAQTHVTIDFDIIKVCFTKGYVKTEIPVVTSPIDIVPDLEPPPVVEPPSDFWIYGVIMIVGLVVVGVVYHIINKGVKESREEKQTADTVRKDRRSNNNKKE